MHNRSWKIGVIGSAAGNIEQSTKKAGQLGTKIANEKCILITGACGGLPFEAAKFANIADGVCWGFSPAANLQGHLDLSMPTEGMELIFTGHGLKGRNVLHVRSADAVIAVAGRMGTLNELTIAYDEKKIIGILTGTGGMADEFQRIVRICNKPREEPIFYESEPDALVTKIVGHLTNNQ